MGRTRKALSIFKDLLRYANHVGLYSEEINPDTLEFMGNFPQAFSHMGLLMAAFELDNALAGKQNLPAWIGEGLSRAKESSRLRVGQPVGTVRFGIGPVRAQSRLGSGF